MARIVKKSKRCGFGVLAKAFGMTEQVRIDHTLKTKLNNDYRLIERIAESDMIELEKLIFSFLFRKMIKVKMRSIELHFSRHVVTRS